MRLSIVTFPIDLSFSCMCRIGNIYMQWRQKTRARIKFDSYQIHISKMSSGTKILSEYGKMDIINWRVFNQNKLWKLYNFINPTWVSSFIRKNLEDTILACGGRGHSFLDLTYRSVATPFCVSYFFFYLLLFFFITLRK